MYRQYLRGVRRVGRTFVRSSDGENEIYVHMHVRTHITGSSDSGGPLKLMRKSKYW